MSYRKIVVGIDLNPDEPQLCYCERLSGDTVTAPMKSQDRDLSWGSIPERLEQGFQNEEEKNALYEDAATWISHAFAAHGLTDLPSRLAGIMITVPKLSKENVEMLRYVYNKLGLPAECCFIQDYRESLYYHTMYQKNELRARNAGFYCFSGSELTFYRFRLNSMTRPVTAEINQSAAIVLPEDEEERDAEFCALIGENLQGEIYSGIFITGDSFDRSWAVKSIQKLCRGGRRVFVVDNLFARGACFAAREKIWDRKLNDYLYLGSELVRRNIGMDMIIKGTQTFYPLVSAGINWFDVNTACEFILYGDPELIISTSGMEDRKKEQYRMTLPGIPERPEGTTRLRLQLEFLSANECRITVTDLGFGEMVPSSGNIWQETLEV